MPDSIRQATGRGSGNASPFCLCGESHEIDLVEVLRHNEFIKNKQGDDRG
jgi:hypothetical protein